MVDIDEFSIHELDAIMRGLRYEHGESTFLTYYMNPKPVRKVILKQLDEDDGVVTARVVEQDKVLEQRQGDVIVQLRLTMEDVEGSKLDTNKQTHNDFDLGLYQQILEADNVIEITWILDEGNAATCVEDFGGDGVEAEGGSDEDEDSDLDRKRRAVLKDLGKEKVCLEGEVHKVKSYIALKDSEVGGPTTSEVNKSKCVRKSQRKRNEVSGPTSTRNSISTNKGKGKDKYVRDKDSSCPWLNLYNLNYKTSIMWGFPYTRYLGQRVKQKKVVGDYTKQYAQLRDYILELQSTNAVTTVKLDLVSEPNLSNVTTRCFKKIYVCLGAMKKGFRDGMRDFLGLDGAFMKGYFPGQILTAASVDSNNGIYPLLMSYLSLKTHKVEMVIGVLLECVGGKMTWIRHIYENMRRTWRTREYKKHLWKCATATTVTEFNHYMTEFSIYDNEA
ncbi:hypothetical protein LXL04_019369 [Taraxacum kok-saghyz]